MLRVALLADYLEEGWPSMDLVADALVRHLATDHASDVQVLLVRPRMPRRFSRLPGGIGRRAAIADRIAARQWDYARLGRQLPRTFDVYHVLDHTYGHLVHSLPADRTIVTCHDVDAFRSIAEPPAEQRSRPFRWMARRILDGLRRAAAVPCDSDTSRDALLAFGGFDAAALSVIPNGADTGAETGVDIAADAEAARLLGPRGGLELLHVGSTIARKRIDVLLDVFAAIRRSRPDARLIRVGGPFTAEQRVHARALGVLEHVAVLPYLDRATLGAVYRRAAVALMPSEREGFGLPIVESLACGTPVVASDIPALREVGGDAVTYCPLAEVATWAAAVLSLLHERETARAAWEARRATGRARAAEFSWAAYATRVLQLYRRVAALPSPASALVDV